MIREALLTTGAAAMLLVGCSTAPEGRSWNDGNGNNVAMNSPESDTAQLAAYAAVARYPAEATTRNDLLVAAIIDRQTGQINIYNFTDKPLAGGNIWINKTYVQKFGSVPARSHTTLMRDKFYDHSGQSLAAVNTPPDSVQLQWETNEVYNLLGPVFQ
jgi:hypothetical protein